MWRYIVRTKERTSSQSFEKHPNHEILSIVPQFAARMQTGREQVRRWIRDGKLKPVRLGKLVRLEESEIRRFLDEYTIGDGR